MNVTQQRMAAIFNEWAKRYAVNPSEFSEIIDENGNVVKDYLITHNAPLFSRGG